MRRATCPTGGSPGRTSPPSWAAAAARGPGRWRRTTRTPPRSGSRRPGWPCARRPGHTPDALWFATSAARLPGQDERHRGRGRPAPAGRRRRLRLRGRAALGHGRAARALCGAAAPPWSSAADLRDGLPTSGDESAGGDAGAAVLVGRRARACWPSSSRRPRPPTSSPTAGGRPATGSPSSGRSASARTATWRSASEALARALKAAGLEAGDVGRLVVTGMHGRAVVGPDQEAGASARAWWPTT